jgi:serine/threonine protein kinase
MTLSSGTKLGPYEIISPLGAGGMGQVYRARVAPAATSPSRCFRNTCRRTGSARASSAKPRPSSLNHPHICTLFDVGRERDTDYLVMELVDGETLAARLARAMPPTVLKLGAQIADALDRAHRAGVVHRDLKPGNVMLTHSGAKLMDFGLARGTGMTAAPGSGASLLTQSPTIAQPLTAEGTIIGTFQYMSPEQLEGKDADARSDIWGLGCVLYEMATGTRAFDGKSQALLIATIMHTDPRPLRELAPASPPALDRLIQECLAKDPEERRQSAGDIRRELHRIARGGGDASPVASRRCARPLSMDCHRRPDRRGRGCRRIFAGRRGGSGAHSCLHDSGTSGCRFGSPSRRTEHDWRRPPFRRWPPGCFWPGGREEGNSARAPLDG